MKSLAIILITLLLILPEASAQASEKPSPYVREFRVPAPYLGPLAIAHARGGNIWFTLEGSNALGVFYPSNNTFSIYDVPWRPKSQVRQYGMEGIAVDRNGIIWFTHGSTSRVGKFDPKTERFSGVVIRPNASVFRVLPDGTGNVWYTDIQNNMIGFVSSDGSTHEFELPTSRSGPAGLAFDSSGRLWFTETFAKKIGIFDPATNTVTEFPPPRDFMNSPVGIVVDKEGILWVADHGGSTIVRFDSKINSWGKFVTSTPPPEIYPVSLPNDIALDKNGNLWVAEHAGNKIARLNPRTGLFTEYVIPSLPAITLWLTLDDNGNVWFAEAQAGKIGKLDTSSPIPFSLSLSTDAITVLAGKESSLSASVDISRSTDPISMSAYGFPNAVNITASPNLFAAQTLGLQNLNLQVRLSHAVDEGMYYFSVSASDGNVFQTRTLVIKVEANRPQQGVMITAVIGLVIITAIAIVAFALLFNHLWKGPAKRNNSEKPI